MSRLCKFGWRSPFEIYTFFGLDRVESRDMVCCLPEGHTGSHQSVTGVTSKPLDWKEQEQETANSG